VTDPVSRLMPRTESSVAAWSVEGRAGVAFSVDRSLRRRWVDRSDPHAGFDAVWMATTDVTYLDPKLWEDAGTMEVGPWVGAAWSRGRTTYQARLGARGGFAYRFPGTGIVTADRYDVEGFLRATGELSTRRPFWAGTTLGARVFAGGYLAEAVPVRQRRILIAGADPYETFTNPLLRSRGALFVRPDFHYHAPGGANLRGFAPAAGGRWAVSANLELTRTLLTRRRGFVRDVAGELFVDVGLVDTLAVPSAPAGRAATTLYDGGVGVVSRHALGDLQWTLRLELPLVVSRWDVAADARPGDDRLAFRWQVSLSPSF
jgi:hypothetical protein